MEHEWEKYHACAEAQLFVALDKPAYDDGDTLHVSVRLVVTRPLAVNSARSKYASWTEWGFHWLTKLVVWKDILVGLNCEEVIEWRRFSSVSARQDTSLVRETAHVLPLEDEDRELAPGEYHFTATFTVPPGLPRFSSYGRGNCSAEIQTYVRCLLWTTSDPKSSRLSTGQRYTLTPRHHELVDKANFDVTLESSVHFLFVETAIVPRLVRMQLDRPGLRVGGGDTNAKITMCASIPGASMPKSKIKTVTLTLIEDVTFAREKKPTATTIQTWHIPVESLKECDVASIDSGDAKLSAGLACDLVLRVDAATVHKAIALKLMRISHRMRLDISYHHGLSSSVEFKQVPLLHQLQE